jgi:hypothetical protein
LFPLRHTHREDQPHKFAAFLTTKRVVPAGVSNESFGGDFYDAGLGILVRLAASTMVWFEPDRSHGTTLPDMDPNEREETVFQAGISIVTSKRIASAFKKEMKAKALKAELQKKKMEPKLKSKKEMEVEAMETEARKEILEALHNNHED